MRKRLSLGSGSVLGICAPSARFDLHRLNQGVEKLKDLGFEVVVPEQIFRKKRYLAGEDIQRASVVNQLFSDKNIDGIICARGGFGAMRILEHLDWDLIKQNPKLFIGFSDNTAMLLSLIEKAKSSVIHGPNVVSLVNAEQETIDSFYQILTNPLNSLNISCGRVIQAGKCTGVFKGGNLATIAHLIGTPFMPDLKDSVLFLEDIGEPAYKIDRMLTQIKMAGCFDRLKGVIAGSFENCKNSEYVDEILFEIFSEYNIPILSGLDCGHGRINHSLIMGEQVNFDTDALNITWV